MKELITKFITLFDKVLIVMVSFLSPVQYVMLAVGAFILLDTIIGIWKAKKLKEKITSRKLANIINKMLIYQLVTISFFTLDYAIINEFVLTVFSINYAMTKIVALTLISIEIFSIDENWQKIKGMSLFEQFKKIILKAKESKDVLKKMK
jgi:hypothetical protein